MDKARFLTMAAAAAAGFAGLAGAATAWADDGGPVVQPLGQQGQVSDGGGVQGWTVTGLQPSADVIPYQSGGALWEAMATDQAMAGGAMPFVPAFSARTANGDDYRVLWQVPTALGVNPAGLAQGQSTTGKLYFDVTAAVPNSVVYSDDGRDQLIWVQPPPSAEGGPAAGYSGAATWPSAGVQAVSGAPQSGAGAGSVASAPTATTPSPRAVTPAAAADDVHGAATAAQPAPATAPLDVHDTTAPATSPPQGAAPTAAAAVPTSSVPAPAAPNPAPVVPTTKAPAPPS